MTIRAALVLILLVTCSVTSTHGPFLEANTAQAQEKARRLLDLDSLGSGTYLLRVTNEGVTIEAAVLISRDSTVTPSPSPNAVEKKVKTLSQPDAELSAFANFIALQITKGVLDSPQDVKDFWEIGANELGAPQELTDYILSYPTLDSKFFKSVAAGLADPNAALGDGFIRDLIRSLLDNPDTREKLFGLLIKILMSGL